MTVAEGDRTDARCTIADCTSSCKELDRLRGDLLKIKWKNKQLHEQLIALQSHTSAREVQTQQTLQRKDDEIFHLSEKVADKQNELYTTLKRNETLRDEVEKMEEAKKKLLDQVEQSHVLMAAMQNQVERYRDVVDEQTLEKTQLQTKVKQLEPKKLDEEEKLIVMDERKTDANALMSDTKAVLMEKAVLIAGLGELRQKLMQHDQHQQQDEEEKDTVCGRASTATDGLEKQLVILPGPRIRDNSTMFELNMLQRSDGESLAEHLDIDALVESIIQTAVQERKDKLEVSGHDNATLNRHVKEHLGHGLKARQGIVDKQLVEVEERNAKHEQQAGLVDVTTHQKQLRVQLRQEQQMDVALSQEFDEQVEADGKLQLAYERLRAEVGKPASLDDGLDIADHLKSQLLANEAVVMQAEIQIYELEAERLRLLQKLRDQARLTDHRLCEQHGLTTEQWIAVEEFIDYARYTPEVVQLLQQPGYKFVGVRDQEQSARRAKNQSEATEGLHRKLGTRCEENAHYLNDTGRPQNKLEEAQSHPLALAIPQPVTTPDDDRGENVRALEAAKAKSQRQERVCYHLRPEVTCGQVQDGDDEVSFATLKDEGVALVVKNNKPESRQAERCTNVTGRREEHSASSEGRAIVDELQHQLMQIKVTYQQFRVQYDLLTETQQQTLLEFQRLVPEMEKKAQELNAVREKSSGKIQVLENAICQVNDRDWTARSTKWKAFRKRLNALEDAIQVEQLRRKQLNKDLEDKQAQLPLLDLRQQCGNQSETGQLKSQVDALETRERLFMGQFQGASNTIGWKKNEMRLQAELFETTILNEDLNRQLEVIQSRISKLLRLNGELEAEKRELRSKYEDLELDLQNTSTGLSDGQKRQQSNQRDVQVKVASLTQLLEEKNTLINEYQRKHAIVQASSAQDKAQDRLETTQLNKKLTEENQRLIAQLKMARITVRIMEGSGKSKQALQAGQECHDRVLQEWKQAEVALKNARQSIREFQIKQEVLQNERDLAKARAMEALEEVVLMREKEEKLKLLCEAVIKLKEEFLKPEDLYAVEIAKAQEVMNQDICAQKRKEKDERREDKENKWQEEKTRLHSQVQMLQKKLALLEIQNQQQRTKRNAEKETAEDKKSALEFDLQASRDEVERLKRLLKDQVVSEARAVEELEEKIKALQAQNFALHVASTHAPVTPANIAGTKEKCEQVENERKLQRRVEILTLRLKEKQADVASKDKDLERYSERVLNLESELLSEKAKHEKKHLTQNARAPAATYVSAKQQVEELEFQNAFVRETLALSRKEWGESFFAKLASNEAQLQPMRWRLVQNGVSLNISIPDHDTNDTIGHGSNSRIQREEQHFLVGQEVQEEILALSNEQRDKEQHVVAKETRLLELELENESLRLEYVRLRRMIRCGSGDLPDSKDAQKQLAGAKSAGNGGRRSLWAAHEWTELEDVVKQMKAAIEELRAENKKLKKAAAKQASVSLERGDSMRHKLKEQKDIRKRLEAQLQKLHHESSELKKDKLRLQEKLRTKAASPSSQKNEYLLEFQLKEKDCQLLQSEQEMAELRHQVLQLQLQVERKADGDAEQQQQQRMKELQTQVLELEEENAKRTDELAAFDEDFFEEIEGLKYKYAQAVRDKHQLEKRLARNVGGVSTAAPSSRRSRAKR